MWQYSRDGDTIPINPAMSKNFAIWSWRREMFSFEHFFYEISLSHRTPHSGIFDGVGSKDSVSEAGGALFISCSN
jgi:hypothetical protein